VESVAMGELSPWRSVLPPHACLGPASAQGEGNRTQCPNVAWGEEEKCRYFFVPKSTRGVCISVGAMSKVAIGCDEE
jgi:hypothetical protein